LIGRRFVSIRGFTIVGAADAGIQVRPSADRRSNSSNIEILDNEIRQSRKRGIDVSAAGFVAIRNNRVIDNGSGGIAVTGCRSTWVRCGEIPSASPAPEIVGNTVARNGGHGIFVESAREGLLQV